MAAARALLNYYYYGRSSEQSLELTIFDIADSVQLLLPTTPDSPPKKLSSLILGGIAVCFVQWTINLPPAKRERERECLISFFFKVVLDPFLAYFWFAMD